MTDETAELELERDGACLAPGLALACLTELEAAFDGLPEGRAGLRLAGNAALGELLGPSGAIGSRVDTLSGSPMQPVRAVLFDKRANGQNWALGWHQDRTIAVKERVDVAGFGPWSIKQGLVHVEPPFSLIERMLTVRIHFDAVDQDNAPLMIARASHRLGRVAVDEIEHRVARSVISYCLAQRGDVWIYRTPILHASDASRATSGSRRVLQVDYCAQDLPGGLEWLGIA